MDSRCVFTVDVEDWFHILDLPSTPTIDKWDSLESRVENNVNALLDIFDQHDVKAVFFFLGWVAKRFPALARSVADAGHEVASHSFSHELVYRMTREQFFEDARRTKLLLEDITGEAVHSYRATGFSVTEKTPWFFEEVARAGYRHDSSVFPARRGHGGMVSAQTAPYKITTGFGPLTEFPVSVTTLLGQRICLFGGGYLRLFPIGMILSSADRLLAEGRPVTFYIHPREVDPDHPRLPMPIHRRFKSYVGLKSVIPKMNAILNRYSFATFSELADAVDQKKEDHE